MKSIVSDILLVAAVVSSSILAAETPRPQQASPSQPAVYILGLSQSSSAVLSQALDTLGYSGGGGSAATEEGAESYTELAVGDEYMDIALVYPNAKFILPLEKEELSNDDVFWGKGQQSERSLNSNYTRLVRDFFARRGLSQQLLELDVQSSKPSVGAEKWVALADFLGLGYSVVERLKLWQFPR